MVNRGRFWFGGPVVWRATFIVVLVCAQPAAAGGPTTTPEIIEMLLEGISEDVIGAKIEIDGCDCDAAPDLIAGLQSAGASGELVSLLINLSGENHPDQPVSTLEIIDLLELEISEEIILQRIEAAGCDCDTAAESIIGLKRAGASDDLVVFLIGRSQ